MLWAWEDRAGKRHRRWPGPRRNARRSAARCSGKLADPAGSRQGQEKKESRWPAKISLIFCPRKLVLQHVHDIKVMMRVGGVQCGHLPLIGDVRIGAAREEQPHQLPI